MSATAVAIIEDGLSTARRLRQSHPLLGIIMLTARSTVADRIAGLNAGADAYLVKPVDMGELAAAIRTVARRVDARR
jgi:two-component system phosphate regulon response regulator OmpR